MEEVDYVSKQANLTAQIETERLADKKWWEDYGVCYIPDSKVEDFSYEKRIDSLKGKLQNDKYKNVQLKTASSSYGCGKPFQEKHLRKV